MGYRLIFPDDKNMQWSPDLAERWEVSDDATSYTFYLRKGAKFHDCLLYTSPSPRDRTRSRMPSSA